MTPQAELEQLVGLIAQHPEGLGIDALLKILGGGWQRRTLQRRLALLVQHERIRKWGVARSVRYGRTPQRVAELIDEQARASDEIQGEFHVPISPEGQEIQADVQRPRRLRKPVGYKLTLLDAYTPNKTAYLPLVLREQLHALGRTSGEQAPAGTFARDILHRLLIDLSWASSKLEGNTYSRLDTERLIRYAEPAEGKDAMETQMILNHKEAIRYLVSEPEHAQVRPEIIIALHAFLSDNLMRDPADCGRIRRRAVEIGGSVYQPIALPQRLEEIFERIVRLAAEIEDPFEQAFFLMVHLPYLQPFEDVNKRVSRLAANIPFVRHNLCPLSFVDVPQQTYLDAMIGVYELNRIELLRDVFVWAYERSCQLYGAIRQSLVPPDPFRLRHRLALGSAIAAIIRDGEDATEFAVSRRIPSTVPEVEQIKFVQLVLDEFKTLHTGNVVRFGIRPLEWALWQDQHESRAG